MEKRGIERERELMQIKNCLRIRIYREGDIYIEEGFRERVDIVDIESDKRVKDRDEKEKYR